MQAIHLGKDRDGRPMAQWAMDALMELLQTKYKAMHFPNSTEDWQNNSTNMPLVAQAKIFCSTKYKRLYDVDSYDKMHFEFNAPGEKQDEGNTKSQTKVPKIHKEKRMVSEILNLVDVFTKTPNCKMKQDLFWGVLKDVTTNLEAEEVDDDRENDAMAGQSHAEAA